MDLLRLMQDESKRLEQELDDMIGLAPKRPWIMWAVMGSLFAISVGCFVMAMRT